MMLDKNDLKRELQTLGIPVVGNYVHKKDLTKILAKGKRNVKAESMNDTYLNLLLHHSIDVWSSMSEKEQLIFYLHVITKNKGLMSNLKSEVIDRYHTETENITDIDEWAVEKNKTLPNYSKQYSLNLRA